jgi:hypothetical protein
MLMKGERERRRGGGEILKGKKELLMYEYLIGIINGKLATIVDRKISNNIMRV